MLCAGALLECTSLVQTVYSARESSTIRQLSRALSLLMVSSLRRPEVLFMAKPADALLYMVLEYFRFPAANLSKLLVTWFALWVFSLFRTFFLSRRNVSEVALVGGSTQGLFEVN